MGRKRKVNNRESNEKYLEDRGFKFSRSSYSAPQIEDFRIKLASVYDENTKTVTGSFGRFNDDFKEAKDTVDKELAKMKKKEADQAKAQSLNRSIEQMSTIASESAPVLKVVSVDLSLDTEFDARSELSGSNQVPQPDMQSSVPRAASTPVPQQQPDVQSSVPRAASTPVPQQQFADPVSPDGPSNKRKADHLEDRSISSFHTLSSRDYKIFLERITDDQIPHLLSFLKGLNSFTIIKTLCSSDLETVILTLDRVADDLFTAGNVQAQMLMDIATIFNINVLDWKSQFISDTAALLHWLCRLCCSSSSTSRNNWVTLIKACLKCIRDRLAKRKIKHAKNASFLIASSQIDQ